MNGNDDNRFPHMLSKLSELSFFVIPKARTAIYLGFVFSNPRLPGPRSLARFWFYLFYTPGKRQYATVIYTKTHREAHFD